VAIVNQTLAREMFGGANPLGRTAWRGVWEPGKGVRQVPVEIVGVVQDAKYRSVRAEVPPTAYYALAQDGALDDSVRLELRSASSAEALLGPLAEMVRSVDPRIGYTPATFSTRVREAMVVERLLAGVCTAFGALALTLAAIGLYGVLAYMVARRRAEIGVRMALGATPARIRNWVLRRMGGTVLAGAALGVALSMAATRYARALLYGVAADDPRVYGAGLALLLAVAAFAAWWPARRAARVDPMNSLRCE
jgi:ABC-type antimicrobial peptide transport system permease subunit